MTAPSLRCEVRAATELELRTSLSKLRATTLRCARHQGRRTGRTALWRRTPRTAKRRRECCALVRSQGRECVREVSAV
ncbi:hypothetical protein JG687_00013358 [Phytophthora cactorum]|uniref:Uncharacterized protein n=1 Tax=Phytophthora cactorum TaxID=29920 RepID=A0A8T1U3X5_9STRA|nr:hypothetical protein JG687_00013358 [Phytophthora cactorum]